MLLSKTILISVLSIALGAEAQYSDDLFADLATRSLENDGDYLDALYARDAEPEPEAEIDAETHLLITRDLHARVADLERALLLARAPGDSGVVMKLNEAGKAVRRRGESEAALGRRKADKDTRFQLTRAKPLSSYPTSTEAAPRGKSTR